MSRYWLKFRCLKGGWSLWTQIFLEKGRSPPTIFGTRKVEFLGYRMVKKIAEKFNRLSRVRQRHRQQTTDGIAAAISERNVVTFAKKSLYLATPLAYKPPTEGFPVDDHLKTFSECQRMAKIRNSIEILSKISTRWVGRTNVTADRQTDRRTSDSI